MSINCNLLKCGSWHGMWFYGNKVEVMAIRIMSRGTSWVDCKAGNIWQVVWGSGRMVWIMVRGVASSGGSCRQAPIPARVA